METLLGPSGCCEGKDFLLGSCRRVEKHLKTGFERLVTMYPTMIGDVWGACLFIGVEIIPGAPTPADTTEGIAETMLDVYRTFFIIDGERDNCFVFKPPLVFGKLVANYLLWALEECLVGVSTP